MTVSLSREGTPRPHAFLESDYASNFSAAELDYSHDIFARDNALHCNVLDGCLQNAVPLRQRKPVWIVLELRATRRKPFAGHGVSVRMVFVAAFLELVLEFVETFGQHLQFDSETQRKEPPLARVGSAIARQVPPVSE